MLLGIALSVMASCLLAAAAWRLAQGPIDLDWLSNRVRAALIDDTAPMHVSFGNLALAWEGFHKGADYPLDLRVSDIRIGDPMGHTLVTAPDAHLTFSFAGLLLGRIVPRTIEVDHAQIAITRDAAGSVNLDWEPRPGKAPDAGTDPSDSGTGRSDAAIGMVDLRQLREQLIQPASSDRSRSRDIFDQIRRAHFHDTEITLRDRQSGLVIQTSGMDLDLVRATNGRIHGSLKAPLSLGGQQTALTATMDLAARSESLLEIELKSFRPAGVQALPEGLAVLKRIDVPISLKTAVGFDTAFKLQHVSATAQLGTGQVLIGQGGIPIRSGAIVISGTMNEIAISSGHLDLAHSAEGAPELVDLSGTLAHISDRFTASLTVGLDQIDIADLPRLWPAGVGGGARPWITEHVTGGLATHGTASLIIEADEALHDIVLTKATGELSASNAAFTWLDDIPPVEQAEVHLHLVDPDTLDIHVLTGHQRINSHASDLLIKDGQMRITGLSLRDQVAEIHVQVDGQITSALALLSEPRLHLLSVHPIAVKPAGGEASASLDIQFPLETKIEIDDVQIRAVSHLTHARVLDVVGGHGLDDGTVDLGVDKDSLTFKGRGLLATIPITLDGTLDFTPGTPDQIVQKIAVTAQPEAMQLDAAGLPVKDVMSGPIAMTAVMLQRRTGDSSISISGDLTQTALKIGPLAWGKPSGVVANATAILLISHDRLTKIDRIVLQGDNLLVTGSAMFNDGNIRSVLLDKIRLGRTQGHGTVHVTPRNVADIVVQGSQVDLAPKLAEKISDADTANAQPVNTPAWTLDAHFDHAILANGEGASNLLAKATGAGDIIRTLDVVGATQPVGGFSIKIEPKAGQRHLSVDAKDAGRFLRGMDVIRVMQSGHLAVDAAFDDPYRLYPLNGTAVIDDVVIQNSPLLGKLLQAITLYGLVDVLRGPGMTFSNILLPFGYDGTSLVLSDAHANNPSLGLTAAGRIGLSSGQTSITGTIVPAYFFNSMLGQLPLVGKLFSPEKGGGVFAVRFGVDGLIEDPSITVNPVSALTPGFLREIFSIFDKPEGGGSTAPRSP